MEYVGNILYDKKLLEQNRTFIIFGKGTYGKKLLHYLDLNGVRSNIICFCDSKVSAADEEVAGIPVYQPIDACLKYPKADYLVCGKYAREMYEILKNYSINAVHILLI